MKKPTDMAEPSDSSLAFFSKATAKQWRFVYELRRDVIKLKADQRSSKKGGPEEFIKLDNWFREKLPQLIKSRKDPHVIYEELVQIAKWRLMMGKYRPKMLDLVRINTESSVVNITRKTFKKLQQQRNNGNGRAAVQQAVAMLVNLKGIGPSTASAILAAAFPEEAPFMSDEGMLSTPGVEATDSTLAEYNNYSEQIRNKADSLRQLDPDYKWTPHKVDQVLWIHYLARDLKPTLLDPLPRDDAAGSVPSSQLPSDAADDNANVMAPATSTTQGQKRPVSMIDGDEEESSQDNLNECSLNGTFTNEDSGSVPYSEEDISQGAASCSVDSTAATIGSDTSGVTGSVRNLPMMNGAGNGTVVAAAVTSNGTNRTSLNNGASQTSTTANITTTSAVSSCIGEEDLSNLSADDGTGSLLMMNNSNDSIPTPSTNNLHQSSMTMLSASSGNTNDGAPSEENSVDGMMIHNSSSLDEAPPPLKKQKTAVGLDISTALAAAEATAGEA